jgi:hypothetical protein
VVKVVLAPPAAPDLTAMNSSKEQDVMDDVTEREQHLTELVDLLVGHDMEAAELADAVDLIQGAAKDPDYAWAEERAPLAALLGELSPWMAVADKLDELHEQLSDLFAEPLPPFPEGEGALGYFDWLNPQLTRRKPEQGGYALMLVDSGFDDNLQALVVFLRDVPRILELANELHEWLGFRAVTTHRYGVI